MRKAGYFTSSMDDDRGHSTQGKYYFLLHAAHENLASINARPRVSLIRYINGLMTPCCVIFALIPQPLPIAHVLGRQRGMMPHH